MSWKDKIKKEDSTEKKLNTIRFFLKKLATGKKYTAKAKLKIGEEVGVGDVLMGLHHSKGGKILKKEIPKEVMDNIETILRGVKFPHMKEHIREALIEFYENGSWDGTLRSDTSEPHPTAFTSPYRELGYSEDDERWVGKI